MNSLVCRDSFHVGELCLAVGFWPGLLNHFMLLAADLLEANWEKKKEKTITESLLNTNLLTWLSSFALFFFYKYRDLFII